MTIENPLLPNPLTYLLFDLQTGDMLAEVPFSGATFSQRLNTPGSFSGKLNYLDPHLQALGLGQVIQPGRTALFVDYLGALIWGGLIWTVNFERASATGVSIQGKEFWSYFSQRVQAKDYTNPTWPTATVGGVPLCGDPMVIASTVVQDAINSSNSAFGASTGFPLSIVKDTTPESDWVAQSYPYTQLQTVDTIVTNLSEMGWGVGFDFGISCAYSSGVPTLTLNMGWPRLGRTATASDVVIDTEIATNYTYPQDSTSQATTIYSTGSGSGTQAIESNPSVTTAGWPLLEVVNSYSNLSTDSMLRQVTKGDLSTQSWPVTTPTVTIPMFGDPAPLEYAIGDDVRWVIPPDERFPSGLDADWRIVGIDYAPSDDGLSTVKLTFNQPPGSSAPQPPT